MRFRDLNQQEVECLWDRWKHIIQEILDEFNEDVYDGRGLVHENSYDERTYLSLETKRECLYIFPTPGNLLLLGLFKCRIEKQRLSLKYSTEKLNRENLICWLGLNLGLAEQRYMTVEDRHCCLEIVLRSLYRKYWVDSSF